MRKVVCILSDAFRFDYVRRHGLNFLRESIASNDCFYVEKVIPSTGFCEIIEYITAKEALQHGLLTQLTAKTDWYSLKRNKFIEIQNFLDRTIQFKKIPNIKEMYACGVNYSLKFSGISKKMIDLRYNIPLRLLQFFEPTEAKYDYDSYDFGGKENLFVWMKENNISYDMSDFVMHNKVKGTDSDRLSRLAEKINKRRLMDFTLLYIGCGELAHFCGTDSRRFNKALKRFSERLREIYTLLRKTYDDSQLIVLGDHGMIDIIGYVNVRDEIEKIMRDRKFKCAEDYIYFIDSTMVRLWLNNFAAIQKVEDRLIESIGKYIECSNAIREYLNAFKPRFGEIILLLRPGYVFFPDFFNVKKIKGMHGYLSSYDEQAGTMISIGKDTKKGYVKAIKLSAARNYIQGLYKRA